MIPLYTRIDTADLRLWCVFPNGCRLVWRRHAVACPDPRPAL